MKFWVYYADGYYDNGDVGLHEAQTEQEAADFIATRLKNSERPNIDNYTVIRGLKLPLKTVEVATRVTLGNP